MKPQLAIDWRQAKLQLPAIMLPKVDGVRGLHITGAFTGRSLKPFGNVALTQFWSDHRFSGLDGELRAEHATHPRLCALTTSMTSTRASPQVGTLMAFDYLRGQFAQQRYADRYDAARRLVEQLAIPQLEIMPAYEVRSLDEILERDESFVQSGYEGSILRRLDGLVKEGRSDNAMQFWRIKRFHDFEATVVGVEAAEENTNEAVTNLLGHTERSTSKAGKVAKEEVGKLLCEALDDVIFNEKVLFIKGQKFRCGSGTLTAEERRHFWRNQGEIVGHIIKVKAFFHGTKEKPRFPTFLSFRSTVDM